MSGKFTLSESAALKDEHAAIDKQIRDWREWWHELDQMGVPHFGEMGNQLRTFRDGLAAHFRHEERLESLDLVASSPRLPMTSLHEEHEQLLFELDQLISRLCAPVPEFDSWSKARAEFEKFLDRLAEHEQTE